MVNKLLIPSTRPRAVNAVGTVAEMATVILPVARVDMIFSDDAFSEFPMLAETMLLIWLLKASSVVVDGSLEAARAAMSAATCKSVLASLARE